MTQRGTARATSIAALCLLVGSLSVPVPARAQTADTSLTGRFQLADSYFRAGQYDRAIHLFQDLYAESPETYLIFDRLKESYESVKRFDEAVRLVDDRMKRTGPAIEMLTEKARLLYLGGNEKGALATWDAAIQLSPRNRIFYRTVALSMAQVRLVDKAIEVLEKGKAVLGPSANFESDLAQFYLQSGRHEQAMETFLQLIDANPQQSNLVRSRLNRLVDQDGAAQVAIDVTERAVRKNPLNRGYREILAWLYTETGDFAHALEAYRAIDRLEKENGRVLYGFAQRVAEAGNYEVAREAYDEVLTKYPAGPIRAEVLLGLAGLYEQWARSSGERAIDDRGNRLEAPRYERALQTLQQFANEFPSHPERPAVLRRIGNLERDVFLDLAGARTALQSALQSGTRDASLRDEAEFDLGMIDVMQGDLDEARLVLNRLSERLRTGELAARARMELALIHFYRGEFDLARDLAEALNENTSMDVANDAIELKVLLMENRGPDSTSAALQMYARGHLLEKQRRYGQTIALMDTMIASLGDHPLLDDARFLRAEALRASGKVQDAVAAYGEIPLMYPTSYLADQALFAMAEMQERDLNDRQAAIQTYTRLLTDYPGSLLVPETRLRIRTLRGDGV